MCLQNSSSHIRKFWLLLVVALTLGKDGVALERTEDDKVSLNPLVVGPGDATVPARVHWTVGEANRRLRCEASGSPTPTITWYTDGGKGGLPTQHTFDRRKMKTIKAANENRSAGWSEIAFAKVHYGLEGNYYCLATNEHGEASRLYHVTVGESVSKTTIVISAIAGTVILILLGLLIFAARKLIRHKGMMKQICKEEIEEFYNGNHNIINATEDYIGSAQVLIQAQPFDQKFEIRRERIFPYNNLVLGSGEFGIVVQGAVQDAQGRMIHAAVKTTRSNVDLDYFRALLSEVKIMSFIGKHPNIVNLIGACTSNIRKHELLVAVEYCQKGNLRDYLRMNRESFRDPKENITTMEPDETNDPEERISILELMRWSGEIARGMEFLSSKNVIHADLACRNVLLTSNLVAKICDFGLSRQLVDYTNYIKKQQSPLPWKWMAIESLKDMHFSVQSDVWSFGICLWEIFSLGEAPYPGQAWSHQFLTDLVNGQRLPSPKFATAEIYEIMIRCWDEDPRSRPSFLKLRETFANMLAAISGRDYMDIVKDDYRDSDEYDFDHSILKDYSDKLLKNTS